MEGLQMEGAKTNIKTEGNRGLDDLVSFLVTSGADMLSLESEINSVRHGIRNPESSDKTQVNTSLDKLVQVLHDKGADLIKMQESINAARQAIKG